MNARATSDLASCSVNQLPLLHVCNLSFGVQSLRALLQQALVTHMPNRRTGVMHIEHDMKLVALVHIQQ